MYLETTMFADVCWKLKGVKGDNARPLSLAVSVASIDEEKETREMITRHVKYATTYCIYGRKMRDRSRRIYERASGFATRTCVHYARSTPNEELNGEELLNGAPHADSYY